MNGSWLDDLARQQATHTSRRQVIKGLIGGLAGVAAVSTVASSVSAATCAGSHKVCTDTACCAGFVCNEHHICIAAECSSLGASCASNDQCCYGYICGESKTCITAAECANSGGGCGGADELCCGDLICGANTTCVAASGNTDTGDAGGTTTLPNTGAGPRRVADHRVVEGAIAAGAVAVAGGLLLRDRQDRATD